MIERQKGDGTSMILVEDGEKPTPQVKQLDLKAEVVLDESIKLVKPFVFPEVIKAVFLTGATGFLGAFLLHDILAKHMEAQVHCLVRAKDDAAAMERLVKNLKVHFLWQDGFASRIVAHAGDLGNSKFGLTPETYDHLAQTIDAIVHNGAMVHWVFPYAQLKAPNVGGTVEALRLACSGDKMKPVHFVSSTSVLDTEHYVAMDIVQEDDNLDAAAGALSVGYAQSKWVSEKIIMLARDRGMPVTITRPGYIVGSSFSGVTQSDDFLWRLMKGCIELKLAPQMLNRVNCCSVDYVSSLIVTLLSSPEPLGKVYHTYNPAMFRFDDFFATAILYGWEMEQVDYLQWRDSLKEKTLDSNDSALYPLLHFVLDDLPTRSLAPRLDNTNSMSLNTLNCMPMKVCLFFSFWFFCLNLFFTGSDAQNLVLFGPVGISSSASQGGCHTAAGAAHQRHCCYGEANEVNQ
jgi:L-aminoadipate-semialdehyde dehydrogenase